MRIAGFTPESMVDGPGLRAVLFTQGCPHQCRGCQNKHTWPLTGGQELSLREVIALIEKNITPLHKGITLSGGEPMLQAPALSLIAGYFGLHLVTYTGFTIEQLLESKLPGVMDLLAKTNILVDGRYEAAQRDLKLAYRGSRNQRLIDVPATLKAGKVILWDALSDAG